jgi:hypothetical protein
MTDKASIRPDMDPELRTKAIAAAWSAWQSRHGGKLGPGPAFTEAIDAVLGVVSPAFLERIAALEAHKQVLASLVAAVSILRRAEERKTRPSKAVASDTMFRQMLADYERAIASARTTLQEHAEDGERQGDDNAS